MYDIGKLSNLETKLAAEMRSHFVEYFRSKDFEAQIKSCASKSIESVEDLNKFHYGRGFYLILTDYLTESNTCSFEFEGLKAIYRGHCHTVKNRLKSHLVNDHYGENLPKNGTPYKVCMKLDGKNGINISELPYRPFTWRVIVLKMNGSSKMIREQAELAFDEVFSRPLASGK